jgi:hypothetical protein
MNTLPEGNSSEKILSLLRDLESRISRIESHLGIVSAPREDSSEADLFRYLIRDLSTGGVIRQERETDGFGNFLKKERTARSSYGATNVMESSFEDTKPYVLTALGKQFVHYVMDDVVPQIGGTSSARPF